MLLDNQVPELYSISSDIANRPNGLLVESEVTLAEQLKQQLNSPLVDNGLAVRSSACCDVGQHPRRFKSNMRQLLLPQKSQDTGECAIVQSQLDGFLVLFCRYDLTEANHCLMLYHRIGIEQFGNACLQLLLRVLFADGSKSMHFYCSMTSLYRSSRTTDWLLILWPSNSPAFVSAAPKLRLLRKISSLFCLRSSNVCFSLFLRTSDQSRCINFKQLQSQDYSALIQPQNKQSQGVVLIWKYEDHQFKILLMLQRTSLLFILLLQLFLLSYRLFSITSSADESPDRSARLILDVRMNLGGFQFYSILFIWLKVLSILLKLFFSSTFSFLNISTLVFFLSLPSFSFKPTTMLFSTQEKDFLKGEFLSSSFGSWSIHLEIISEVQWLILFATSSLNSLVFLMASILSMKFLMNSLSSLENRYTICYNSDHSPFLNRTSPTKLGELSYSCKNYFLGGLQESLLTSGFILRSFQFIDEVDMLCLLRQTVESAFAFSIDRSASYRPELLMRLLEVLSLDGGDLSFRNLLSSWMNFDHFICFNQMIRYGQAKSFSISKKDIKMTDKHFQKELLVMYTSLLRLQCIFDIIPQEFVQKCYVGNVTIAWKGISL